MPDDRPASVYAASHLGSMRSRWDGELGRHVRAMKMRLWPSTPAQALVALTSNGSQREDTCPGSNTTFHEIGFFQTPAGPCSGPAPNPDPRAAYNAWGRYASLGMVRDMLGGRGATMVPGAWREAVADQAAIGLADYRQNLSSLQAMLPRECQVRDEGKPWQLWCAVMAYGAGPAGAYRILMAHRGALVGVPDDDRCASLVRSVARSGTAAQAHRVNRAWQRHEAGRQLALATGDSGNWWRLGFASNAEGVRLEEALSARARGGRPRVPGGGSGAGALPLLALAGVGLYAVSRARGR